MPLAASTGGQDRCALSVRELRHWRDALIKKGLSPATVKRTGKAFKAALNLLADQDPRITNRSAWQVGLASLPDAEESRNVILPDDVVLRIIAAAYEESPSSGFSSRRQRSPAPEYRSSLGSRSEIYRAIVPILG